MELDLTTPLEDCGSIHVALVPVGSIDASTFDRYSELCSTHNTLDLFQITHGHSHGVLRLRFVAGPASDVVRSEWEDLHAHRRVRAIVGLCHCPSESDLQEAVRLFSQKPSAQTPSTLTGPPVGSTVPSRLASGTLVFRVHSSAASGSSLS